MAHGRGNPPYYVPTALLAELLGPILDEFGEEIPHEHQDGSVELVKVGGIERLSQRVPSFLSDIDAHSVPRRIWAIIYVETMRTSTEIADSLLLAADRMIEDTTLPTFPAHGWSAQEMVDIHNEQTDDPIAPEDQEAFCKQMIAFCKAFCIGMSMELEEVVELEAAKVTAAFLRAHNVRDELLVAA